MGIQLREISCPDNNLEMELPTNRQIQDKQNEHLNYFYLNLSLRLSSLCGSLQSAVVMKSHQHSLTTQTLTQLTVIQTQTQLLHLYVQPLNKQ